MLINNSARAGGGLLLIALMALSIGCGGGAKQRGTVKGKVVLGDKHLTVGNVTFYGKDNLTGTTAIDKNGNYVLNDAPIGDVKIAVSVPKLPPGGMKMMNKMKNSPGMKDIKSVDPEGSGKSISIMGDMPDTIVPIPDKYANPETSGLTYKVVAKGEHTHDITLTP